MQLNYSFFKDKGNIKWENEHAQLNILISADMVYIQY